MKAAAAVLTLALHFNAGASDVASLTARDPAWNTLRAAGNADALEALIDDGFVLIHSDGQIENKTGYLAQLRTKARVNQAIVNEDVRVRTYGSTGIVNGISVQSGVSDGKPWSGRFRFTRTWVWRGNDWVLV
ncbi:MAG TPA: nuclear transport factor 2 family protein, partial [Burkholderiaceae bacterium]